MKLHPTAINDVKSYEDLGRQIMAMRYDVVQQVLVGMIAEARRQQANDDAEGKVKLAYRLNELACGLENANTACDEVMHICEEHINAEKAYRAKLPNAGKYETRQILWNVKGS